MTLEAQKQIQSLTVSTWWDVYVGNSYLGEAYGPDLDTAMEDAIGLAVDLGIAYTDDLRLVQKA